MSNVLFVKVNDRPVEQAVSVQMYAAFLDAYKETNPSDTVTEIDLFKENIPYYGNDAITGLYKVSQQAPLTEAEDQMVKVINKYMDQFLAADKVVIAFPTWNLTVPAPLMTYISYLAQTGKTFKYTAEGPVGLITDKKIMLLNARGGNYSLESTQLMEFACKPTKSVFSGLMGASVEEVIIEGHQHHPDRASEIIQSGLEKTKKVAASF
ncbi:FMN-dependent NADH-azoreductase [Shimazuella sp. AN120528]|uniref:FMN-dependent NADH-azoreductase n=1 Tax=Shimazuella soli TaxID=1892854 RepID=UPI001F0F7D16|nr:FMN-dependent NADH-azoreductase [Shimazuella soli]MCH5584535.1 FMN-dependent NADH-azoreductase [Shimazuella soli]